jgi:hypothetical protein
MELNKNPLLEKAKFIYDNLQEDVQKLIMEEYIKPQLICDYLIEEFDKLIESEKCQQLKWQVLLDVVGKIIENKEALAQMRKKDTLGFNCSYENHFIKKINTFKHPSFDDKPLESMCAELTMLKWH